MSISDSSPLPCLPPAGPNGLGAPASRPCGHIPYSCAGGPSPQTPKCFYFQEFGKMSVRPIRLPLPTFGKLKKPFQFTHPAILRIAIHDSKAFPSEWKGDLIFLDPPFV